MMQCRMICLCILKTNYAKVGKMQHPNKPKSCTNKMLKPLKEAANESWHAVTLLFLIAPVCSEYLALQQDPSFFTSCAHYKLILLIYLPTHHYFWQAPEPFKMKIHNKLSF